MILKFAPAHKEEDRFFVFVFCLSHYHISKLSYYHIIHSLALSPGSPVQLLWLCTPPLSMQLIQSQRWPPQRTRCVKEYDIQNWLTSCASYTRQPVRI